VSFELGLDRFALLTFFRPFPLARFARKFLGALEGWSQWPEGQGFPRPHPRFGEKGVGVSRKARLCTRGGWRRCTPGAPLFLGDHPDVACWENDTAPLVRAVYPAPPFAGVVPLP